MNFIKKCLVILAFTVPYNVNGQTEALSDEFHRAPDNLKLYYAYAEFKMAHYQTAKLMWENIDEKGKPEAYFNLGILYELGKGVDVDIEKASKFYRQAAELGSFSGAYQMGLMHLTAPEYVSKEESVHWLGVAATEGDEDALRLLAAMNSSEIDNLTKVRILLAKEQYEEAIARLNFLAKDNGLTELERAKALTQLGWIYEIGKGVEADLNQAANYFTLGAELGDPEAMYSIAVMHLTGKGKSLDSELGNKWMKKSADLGFAKAKDKTP